MAENKSIDFYDYIIFTLRRKKFFIILGMALLITVYLLIYFLLLPQYDSKAVLLSKEDSKLNPIMGLTKSIPNIPFSNFFLDGFSSTEMYDLFTTLIYSRSNIEELIGRFNLMEDYNLDRIDKAIKAARENITTNITEEMAYEISVRASSREKSAEMANYIVAKLNDEVISMNTKKSRDNRIFVEKRYNEIKNNLRIAEDSLRNFQEKAGIFEVENQTKSALQVYADLESRLATKQVELSVMKEIYGEDSPVVAESKVLVEKFSNKLRELKQNASGNDLLLSIDKLPENALNYYRLYRDVEIYNSMLEFIIPLYEQMKYEEIKDIPVLQIIDYAVPPIKKSYPPRTLLTIAIVGTLLVIISIIMFLNSVIRSSENAKIRLVLKELQFKSQK